MFFLSSLSIYCLPLLFSLLFTASPRHVSSNAELPPLSLLSCDSYIASTPF
jgi:hypothetical protein